jgi:hypothetical protein
MKSLLTSSPYDLPIAELRLRVARARRALCELALTHRSPGASLVHDAFAAVERLVPGFLASRPGVLARTLADLAPRERQALRETIRAERLARERRVRLLGDVAPSVAEDTLERVEEVEALADDLRRLVRALEPPPSAAMLA